MDPRNFESAIAIALTAHTSTQLDRFSLRRDVSGPVDAVANVRGEVRLRDSVKINPPSVFESIRAAGNRITARLGADVLFELAAAVEQARAVNAYGGNDAGAQHILVDFCDPNATKPLHVGHLRNIVIGAGLVRLLEFAGARVVTQSVLGDIGRSVAEAMAGVEFFGAPSEGGKTDHWVGACYARYVREYDSPTLDEESPDAPIARELQARGDRADQLLTAWLEGDRTVRDTWKSLVDGVTDGQNQTLARLCISIGSSLAESEGALMASSWLNSAIEAGVAVRRDDGAVVFETGRESYPALLLARSDGVPTEHLRALPLWSRLQHEGCRYTRCFHVMGTEWLVTTELREALVRKLTSAPLYDRYVKLAHGFVTVRGSKMKSSDGQALTIDEALDRLGADDNLSAIVAQSSGLWNRDGVAASLMTSTFTAVALMDSCDVDPDMFCTVRAHQSGLAILHAALSLAENPARGEFRPDAAVDRYLVLQAARLPGFLNRALASGDLCELFRFVHRVAMLIQRERVHSRSATYAASWIIAHGLKLMGIQPLWASPNR